MTAQLIYPPVRDGYSFTPGQGNIVTKLRGGAARIRKDILEPSHTIQANWVLKETEYTEFMGFFHSTLQEASLPFLVDLVSDLSIPTPHKCRCVEGGRPRLTANRGNAFYVSALLEVENNATYTGEMELTIGLPGFPGRVDTSPHILSQYQVTDLYLLHRVSDGILTFDGLYTCTGKPTANIVQDANAHLVNAAWSTLNSGAGITTVAIGTITRVPT